MNSSKERNTFQIECKLKAVEEGHTTAESAEKIIEIYRSWDQQRREQELKPEWQENNLEYDLRSTAWICDKAKASDGYAQNIYAALCNTEWQRNDVWPLLKDQRWSCSWRYAGGIVADMREEGDYIDWYCSGIGGVGDVGSEFDPDAEAARLARMGYVGEGVVTDEIREDFFRLGWILVDDKS